MKRVLILTIVLGIAMAFTSLLWAQSQAEQPDYGRGYNRPWSGTGPGWGMGPHMMGPGQGRGMGPGMMGGCGMGPGMMGYYSPEQYEKQFKENQKFLDETQGLRKKLHTLKFDFAEARRNPATKPEDLEIMNTEMESIWKQIDEKRKSVFK